MLTDREIIGLFEAHNPRSVDDIAQLGLAPVLINRGTARAAYKIGRNLVAKVCHNNEWSVSQSQQEIAAIEKINGNSELEKLLPSVMPLFYGNKETGTIVTKFYPELRYNELYAERIALEHSLIDIGVGDLWEGNFRKTEKGTVVAVDLGCYAPV